MGVVIHAENFDTFDLIRDLAKAREDLYAKQNENKSKSQTEPVETNIQQDGALELEWLDTKTSELEDPILAEFRRDKRENKKARRFSPLVGKKKKKDQEDLGQPKKRGRPCIANPPKLSKTTKK